MLAKRLFNDTNSFVPNFPQVTKANRKTDLGPRKRLHQNVNKCGIRKNSQYKLEEFLYV